MHNPLRSRKAEKQLISVRKLNSHTTNLISMLFLFLSGSKILIPDTYGGFFELLSEDGKATRSFENVFELSRRRNIKVLVRESFVIRNNNSSKTLHAGEILTPLSDNGKVLQCKTSKNLLINLPLDCKAKFSPIATKEDSISGVHSVRCLNCFY